MVPHRQVFVVESTSIEFLLNYVGGGMSVRFLLDAADHRHCASPTRANLGQPREWSTWASEQLSVL